MGSAACRCGDRLDISPREAGEWPLDQAKLGKGCSVKLTFLGTSSENGQCPTFFATDRGTFVVQGWKVTDPDAIAQMDIPAHETAVEIPAELLRYAPRPNA